jgi:hypothetical protein
MVERQRIEAESLMHMQTLERGNNSPLLAVSFPFPEVFDQLKSSLNIILE